MATQYTHRSRRHSGTNVVNHDVQFEPDLIRLELGQAEAWCAICNNRAIEYIFGGDYISDNYRPR